MYNIDEDLFMAESLREIRKKLGFTQEQAAKVLKISRRTYQTYEDEDNELSDQLKIIRDFLAKNLADYQFIDETHGLLTIKQIQHFARLIFERHPQIKCAYLFGSYARGEATEESDVDILVTIDGVMGMELYGVANELEEKLHKKVDLVTHRQVVGSEEFLQFILEEGVKIYGQKTINKSS